MRSAGLPPDKRRGAGRAAGRTRSDERPIVILGAGGHGRVVLDVCRAADQAVAGFVDGGYRRGTLIDGCPVLGGDALLRDRRTLAAYRFVPGLGDAAVRRRLSLDLIARGATLASVFHPSCIVSPRAAVGEGSVLVAGAVVNTGARIGRFCIVNTGATVDHDCVLDDGVQVAPNGTLCGDVHCGEDAFIGAGAVVLPGVRVGARAVIGAGAAVTADIPAGLTVVGKPARRLRSKA